MTVPPGESVAVTFLLAWHFPNRMSWDQMRQCDPEDAACCSCDDDEISQDFIGNYYTTQYADAWDVAKRTGTRLDDLEARTVAFVRAFSESDLPAFVKEAALFNLSTLRTQTCFRTPDGRFYGWEGGFDDKGCCPGSCTHVWNYEQTTAFLFGDLARTMRDVEFSYATDANGRMPYRVILPVSERSQESVSYTHLTLPPSDLV